jgi:serine/threonine protein kinase
MPQSDQAYCFNPTCQAPTNLAGHTTCQSCGATLSFQNRYQGVQRLGNRGATPTRTFLALDHQTPGHPYCIIQQFCDHSHATALPVVSQLEILSHHPQIPSSQDYFEQDGLFYWVQDYIPGQTLAAQLIQHGKLKVDEVWHILENLLPILQFIHSHQVIHGDIKPTNLIVAIEATTDRTQTDTPPKSETLEALTLVDFSTAQWVENGRLSILNATLGDAAFSAPEQIRGQPTFASDLYSLGMTCLHLLTQMHPFDLMDAADRGRAWKDVLTPENPTDSESSLQLIDVLDRLIAPQLNQRFASAKAAMTHIQSLRGKRILLPQIASRWQCHAPLIERRGLPTAFNAVAISPDEKWIASGSNNASVEVWSMATRSAECSLKGHHRAVLCLAFAPHSKTLLATGSRDRTVKLWDLQTRQVTHTLTAHHQSINAIAFSPDGQSLASGSADKTINLWNASSGRLIATLCGPKLGITAIAFSPHAPIIAGASVDSSIQIWNTDTLERIHLLTEHRAAVKAIAFSPTEPILATGSEDRTIRLWDAKTWQCICTLSGHAWPISALAFSPNGKYLFSGSWDKTIKVWAIPTKQSMENLVGHHDTVSGIAIASSGKVLVSSSLDKTLRIWRC